MYPNEKGLWKAFTNNDTILLGISHTIRKIEELIKDLEKIGKDKAITRRLELFRKLVEKLKNEGFASSVASVFIRKAAQQTADKGFPCEQFDSISGYIGFRDGVYSFEENRLLTKEEATPLYVIRCLNEEFMGLGQIDPEFTKYIEQILPNVKVRIYVGCCLNLALQMICLRLVLVHYNTKGSNGKSKFFDLLGRALTSIFQACTSGLISTNNNEKSGAPNEDLMNLEGKLIACYSEPDKKQKINTAFLKKISGGDAITGSKKNKKNRTFNARVLQNILCNGIPSFDDDNAAGLERFRVIKWESESTADMSKVDHSKNIYAMDYSIEDKFNT